MDNSKIRFNPCFNGYSTLTSRILPFWNRRRSFNPCFNGYSTLTDLFVNQYESQGMFQSLF